MASVQYMVMYKYMHPTAKKSITNTTMEEYGVTQRFIKDFNTLTESQQANTAILAQQSPQNQKYDMLFMYDGVLDVSNVVSPGTLAANKMLMVEKFARCNGEAWFVSSIHTSLQSAISRATPIIKSIGKENVRVVKNVPIDINVVIE